MTEDVVLRQCFEALEGKVERLAPVRNLVTRTWFQLSPAVILVLLLALNQTLFQTPLPELSPFALAGGVLLCALPVFARVAHARYQYWPLYRELMDLYDRAEALHIQALDKAADTDSPTTADPLHASQQLLTDCNALLDRWSDLGTDSPSAANPA
ncbi:hypothetical protein [Ferrimonas marina]|uniref:Uncharacterized protein n=1 Tax=Ferrimonas marina TaxID=299255 RepID=A0A1M5U6P0_9GAMM|nr:hypothetical protein [Ferrimonas marina]SHH58725.1 hypothetical protein SAMN02745129_2433 [Ferrimonas marina]